VDMSVDQQESALLLSGDSGLESRSGIAVSGKHDGSADEGLSIVGLDLARTPSSRYETSESGMKLFSR